jgi:DinB superfamily
MTDFNKKNLLSGLHDRTEVVRNNLQPFLRLSQEELNYKIAPGEWSIAEVFEHLNITHSIYLHAINEALKDASINAKEIFKSNWLGNWAYEKIIPREDGSILKMKAPKFLHPPVTKLNGAAVLEKYMRQSDEFDHILELSQYVDLQKVKIPFSFTKLLKLRLGDNLRFIVAHNERHLLQAQRVLKSLPAE